MTVHEAYMLAWDNAAPGGDLNLSRRILARCKELLNQSPTRKVDWDSQFEPIVIDGHLS